MWYGLRRSFLRSEAALLLKTMPTYISFSSTCLPASLSFYLGGLAVCPPYVQVSKNHR